MGAGYNWVQRSVHPVLVLVLRLHVGYPVLADLLHWGSDIELNLCLRDLFSMPQKHAACFQVQSYIIACCHVSSLYVSLHEMEL